MVHKHRRCFQISSMEPRLSTVCCPVVQEIGNSDATRSHSSSGPRPWLKVQQLDLNSLRSVRHFCQVLHSLDPQPSLLICNAGRH